MRLRLDLEQDMEPVDLDPKGIQVVLVNLTGNAIDACTLGKTEIQNPEVLIKSRRLPDEKILLEVGDNGIGMDQEIRQKLFNIFFSTKGSRGTGLGLLISQKIVREHGGEILFHSEPLKGSVFQVVLPIRMT